MSRKENMASERVVLLPGYNGDLAQPDYRRLCNFAEVNYDTVDRIEIPWEEGAYRDWFLAARKQIANTEADVIGFSCGALIALQLSDREQAPDLKVNSLTLISTSSWGGYRGSLKSSDQGSEPNLTREQYESLEMLPVDRLARNCGATAVKLFYGEKELPEMVRRSQYLAKLLGNRASLMMVPSAEHSNILDILEFKEVFGQDQI